MSQVVLVAAPGSQPLPSVERNGSENCQYGTRLTTRVCSAAVVLGYMGAAVGFAEAFTANPEITFAAGMAAGSARPLAAVLIDTDQDHRPLAFDRGLYGFLTKFDVPLFLTLNIAQWITPQTNMMRMVWFPLIFLHGGSVISWEVMQKLMEHRANHGQKRPLLEGDTEGSLKPFVVKGALFLTAGVASAIFGGIQKSHAAWRLGFMGMGYGVGVGPAQQIFSRLKRLLDAPLSPSERRMQGTPLEQKVLAKLASISSSLGKIGVSAAGAILVTLPVASADINAVAAVCNFFLGFPMAFVDISQQHRFQNPEVDFYEPLSDSQEERSCFIRAWRAIESRPADYAGVAGTGLLMTAMVVGNIVYPTENSILYASLLAGGAAGTFALGRAVEWIHPPAPGEEYALWNELVFRGTRSAYAFGAALIPLLGIYVSGKISLLEFDFLWTLYGATVGASVHEMLTMDPTLTPYVSILYLLLFSVTSTLFIEGQI